MSKASTAMINIANSTIPAGAPSAWVQRWSHLVPAGAAVLDVACGAGRHLRWFHALGHPVTGIDRDPPAVQAAALVGEAIEADIENGPWPLAGRPLGGGGGGNYPWGPPPRAPAHCAGPGRAGEDTP